MTLRCFLFCTDEGTSDVIRQVLTALGVEVEVCAAPSAAVQTVSSEAFQLVIIDWDQQPEAAMVLHAAQERKVSERPLTLAIVSDDGSAPKALQAGANSTLRRPLAVNQVTDTLTTARDLLRSRFAPAKSAAVAAAANTSSSLPGNLETPQEKTLRSGEFLQSAPIHPGGQFVTESEPSAVSDVSVTEPVDALKDLEPVAAAAPPSPPPAANEPKGLEWYLKRKGLQSVYTGAAAAPAPAPAPAPDNKPELLGYDISSSSSPSQKEEKISSLPSEPRASRDTRKEEAALFSYITGESEAEEESSPSRFRIGKSAMIAASVLAAIAIVAAPQAPWHPRLKVVLGKAQHSLHVWLHPQPMTAVSQAPISHEDFGRPGDEYKLPVAETIPDATTDPSQIQVLPAVDPNAKKPAPDASAPDQGQAPVDQTNAPAPDASQTPAVQVQENPQANQPAPTGTSPTVLPTTTNQPATAVPAPPPPTPTIRTEVPPSLRVPLPSSTAPAVAPAPRQQPSQYLPPGSKVPSSLQSQMTVMVPEASGNKPIDSAMPAIEPVTVSEAAERALLIDQPAIGHPASAKGQQGTVIVQVLVGRDGAVQDAKFVQGSLAFARNAIDGVRQWKFKPYTMNGRPVSVQTTLTIKFKP